MADAITARQAPATRADHAAPARYRRSGLERAKARIGLLLVMPAFLFVAVFVLIPVGFAVYLSFTNYPLIGPDHWVGLQNWGSVGQDATFVQSVLFTLEYTAIVTPAIFLVGYGLAVLVRRRRRGSALLRTLFFLPYVVGLVTESFLLLLELQPGSGGVNAVLRGLHVTNGQTAWLVHTNLALAAVCVLVVWFASGLTMVLLVAGMRGIPGELLEASALDGASWLDQELRIRIPLLRRTIALTLIISVVGSLLAFNQFYILTQGGPGTSTDTVVMWIYQVAFVQLHLGKATAMSLILVVLVGFISFVQFFALRERGA
ncbi:MAG TPA: sugar ABC transporter permease [Streptosporangiaceae bacterium]|jgi:multiple sugar transport system permease protein|nr:sugar ABC transporter permease [Streptosporangiaceae bacterium]